MVIPRLSIAQACTYVKRLSITVTVLVLLTIASANITINGLPAIATQWKGENTYKLPLPIATVNQENFGRGSVVALAVGGQGACESSEFFQPIPSSPAGSSLVNRHKYCLQMQSQPSNLSVDLMQVSPNSQWEYYRPNVAFYQVRTFDVGTLAIRTKLQAYGDSKVLAKTYKIDVEVTSFAFAAEFPAHLRSDVNVVLTPEPQVNTYNDSSITNFSISAGAVNPIILSGSAGSGTTGAFDVGFSWNYSGSDPTQDYITVAPFMPRWIYSVKNTPRHLATDPFRIDADGASSIDKPRLRCDHSVATTTNGFRNGCVFVEASPILEMSKSGAGAEAAAHIELAQTTLIGKSQYSPGVFTPLPGARAIANESAGIQFGGVTRGDTSDSDINRPASCGSAGFIWTRPYNGSASCPQPAQPKTTPPGCQCDEYPFATTKNGGGYNAAGTSARFILSGHNSFGGSQYSNLINTDRVFRGEKFWVRVVP